MTFKKGDLVMVVKPMPCCGDTSDIGRVESVEEMAAGNKFECRKCLKDLDDYCVALFSGDDGMPTCTLIKIDPPADQDQETTDRELEVLG